MLAIDKRQARTGHDGHVRVWFLRILFPLQDPGCPQFLDLWCERRCEVVKDLLLPLLLHHREDKPRMERSS